jgi:hypothetical protein
MFFSSSSITKHILTRIEAILGKITESILLRAYILLLIFNQTCRNILAISRCKAN